MRGSIILCKMQLIAALSVFLLSSGCGSKSSDSTPADTITPTAPTYVTSVAASWNKVSLRWAASTDNVGVTAYSINRNGSPLVTTTTATTVYSDTTCTGSTIYTYTVAARDAAGNVSALSSNATAATFDYGNADSLDPDPPTGLIVTASTSTQISLSWTAAHDNKGVSGYNIYRAASKNGTSAIVGTSTTTSYTDTGLNSATSYFYVVTSFDGVPNESLNSNQATATTQ